MRVCLSAVRGGGEGKGGGGGTNWFVLLRAKLLDVRLPGDGYFYMRLLNARREAATIDIFYF